MSPECLELRNIYRVLEETLLVTKNYQQCHKSHCEVATKQDLIQLKESIMSLITDWAAKEQADLTAIQTTLAAIVVGIQALDDKINALNNSPGTLSPTDQAVLDSIVTASDNLVTQAAAINVNVPTNPQTLAGPSNTKA